MLNLCPVSYFLIKILPFVFKIFSVNKKSPISRTYLTHGAVSCTIPKLNFVYAVFLHKYNIINAQKSIVIFLKKLKYVKKIKY